MGNERAFNKLKIFWVKVLRNVNFISLLEKTKIKDYILTKTTNSIDWKKCPQELPPNGDKDTILVKKSDNDYDMEWVKGIGSPRIPLRQHCFQIVGDPKKIDESEYCKYHETDTSSRGIRYTPSETVISIDCIVVGGGGWNINGDQPGNGAGAVKFSINKKNFIDPYWYCFVGQGGVKGTKDDKKGGTSYVRTGAQAVRLAEASGGSGQYPNLGGEGKLNSRSKVNSALCGFGKGTVFLHAGGSGLSIGSGTVRENNGWPGSGRRIRGETINRAPNGVIWLLEYHNTATDIKESKCEIVELDTYDYWYIFEDEVKDTDIKLIEQSCNLDYSKIGGCKDTIIKCPSNFNPKDYWYYIKADKLFLQAPTKDEFLEYHDYDTDKKQFVLNLEKRKNLLKEKCLNYYNDILSNIRSSFILNEVLENNSVEDIKKLYKKMEDEMNSKLKDIKDNKMVDIPESKRIFCPICGTKLKVNKDNRKYCPKCGWEEFDEVIDE